MLTDVTKYQGPQRKLSQGCITNHFLARDSLPRRAWIANRHNPVTIAAGAAAEESEYYAVL